MVVETIWFSIDIWSEPLVLISSPNPSRANLSPFIYSLPFSFPHSFTTFPLPFPHSFISFPLPFPHSFTTFPPFFFKIDLQPSSSLFLIYSIFFSESLQGVEGENVWKKLVFYLFFLLFLIWPVLFYFMICYPLLHHFLITGRTEMLYFDSWETENYHVL